MPPPVPRRCICSFKRCNQFVDPSTGLLGRELSSRAFRAHQDAEAEYLKAQEMQALQLQIIQNHEAKLAEQLRSTSQETPHQPPLLSATSREYRINKDKKYLDLMGPIKQQTSILKHKLHDLPPLNSNTSTTRIHIREQELQSILLTAMPLRTDVQVIGKALRGRTHSVKEMHSRIKLALDQLNVDVERSLGACKALAEQRRLIASQSEERPGFFDTGTLVH